MNYYALDEALFVLETGTHTADFIMNDMFRSIDFINESAAILNEADEPKTTKGFKAFLHKLVEALKKAIVAIGKFFSTIWKKFKDFVQKLHNKMVPVSDDILKLTRKNPKFKEFMETEQFEMTDNFNDISRAIFDELNHVISAGQFNSKLYKEFVDKTFADNIVKVTPDQCIKIHSSVSGKNFMDRVSRIVDELQQDEKDYKRELKDAQESLKAWEGIEQSSVKLGMNDHAANAVFQKTKAKMDITNYTKRLKTTSNKLSALTIVLGNVVSAIQGNEASYNRMMTKMREFTNRADEYSDTRGPLKYNELKYNELKTNKVKTNDSPKPFKPESFEYNKFEPKTFEFDKFEI